MGSVVNEGVVIVGCGHAGLAVAEHLRKGGYGGALALIGAEPHPPYQRPPLSKSYLLGGADLEKLFLKPQKWFSDNDVSLRTATTVVSIDRAARTVLLDGAPGLRYRHLVLATGARARRLPQSVTRGLGGIHVLRDVLDVDRFRSELGPGRRLLVVGGGYIGLEMAAVARKVGMQVTLIETADRLLSRVACAETAAWIAELHRANGVDLRLGVGLDRLDGEGRVAAARLSDGTRLAVDCVVVGIGSEPETALASDAGLRVSNGVLVDPCGRTDDPAVWAVGDCACYALNEGPVRFESVGNAISSAAVVARNILGGELQYLPEPWFWSDQYDAKLQIAGLSGPADDVVVREAPGEGRSHWYFRRGRLVAVDALNAPRAYMAGRRLLGDGKPVDPASIADPQISLKELVAA